MNKAVFLDRDGVINKEVNYLHKKEDFQFTENCIEALKILQSHGYLLFIITNQAGIGRGYYSEQDFEQLTQWMLGVLNKNGVKINDVKFCPHHPEHGLGKYKTQCSCRKPEIGMLTPLIEQYNIDVNNSILVGDKISDITAGKNANISSLILVESGHDLPKAIPDAVTEVHKNLYQFAISL
jgi:D,D-heptose 1,7-bisphosphate phosphatase